MRSRDIAKTTFLKSKSPVDKSAYNKIRNLVLKMQRKEKAIWISRMFGDNGTNAKKIWRTVKIISGDSKRKSINKISVNGMIVTKPADIANGLNEAFVKKVEKLKKTITSPSKGPIS